MVFDMVDIDISIANSIRRVILSEIPNIAVSFDPYSPELNDLKFIVNTTSLHNEFMGHRISLIPLLFNPDEISSFDPSKYRFMIDVHNKGTEIMDVTTEHIRVFDEDDNELPELHLKLFVRNKITKDYILITKLKPNLYNKEHGEHLQVEFRCRVGNAKQNARYSPVSTCTYFNVIDDEKADEAFADSLAQQESKENKKLSAEEKAVLKKRFDVHDRYRLFHKNEFDEANRIRFTIESECRMTPRYLVDKALDILISKANKLINDADDNMSVKVIDADTRAYAITIFDEDHTLGNLIQALMYNKHIRSTDKKLAYIGYFLPHPLVNEIVVKLIFNKDATDINDVNDVIGYISSAFNKTLVKTLTKLKEAWDASKHANANDDDGEPKIQRIKGRKASGKKADNK
jgi:DNA-directed RNA polymerase subunit L